MAIVVTVIAFITSPTGGMRSVVTTPQTSSW